MRVQKTALLVSAAMFLAAPATSSATPHFKRLSITNEQVGVDANFGMARTPDGALHLIAATHPTPSATSDGLAAIRISKAGSVGAPTPAVSGYNPNHPALVAQGPALSAFFGGASPDNLLTIFQITSNDGGATWSAPQDVLNHDTDNAQSYAADVVAAMSGTTPVLALPHNDIVVQQGLGSTAPTSIVTNSSDNATTGVDVAVDGATGAVVAGWPSLAGNGGDWLEQVAPTVGAATHVPGASRNQLVPAGRSNGPGVFAAYSPDNKHVRLLRYSGGTLAVGSVHGVTPTRLAAATGPAGRIWVVWGAEDKLAVTRSNMAVTRFEPIQRLRLNANGLARLSGDGALGPLDLFADGLAPGTSKPATMYARVLAQLSAKATLSKGKLSVTVTDAGDPVSGATVSAAGKQAKTNSAGKASLNLGKKAKHATVQISAAGYNPLTLRV